MAAFGDFINRNNKIMHKACIEYVITQQVVNFIHEVRWPLLVGKDLFQGDFSKKEAGKNIATFRFKPSEEPDEAKKSLVNAVYAVKKREEGNGDLIFVGRTSESDITINDYAISKRHAAFVRKSNQYFITDLGSTNGVMVNNKKAELKHFVPLKMGKSVVLGRFSFLFAHPIYYYCMVYAQQLSTFPAQKDLLRIAEEVDTGILFQVAKQNGFEPGGQTEKHRSQIINHMKSNLSHVELIKWLCSLPFSI